MKEIHKILVPVDFSSHSRRALDEAVGLALVFHAEIHLLHCYSIHPGVISPYGVVVPETYDYEVRMAAIQRLVEWRDTVRAQNVTAHEHITAHSPSTEIAAMAEKLGADLIVMGTRGLTGFKHVLMGSVTERAIRIAPCPVLTVKDVDAH
jgi:nucleotide-binding universal stress UspA family protein